jgi:hypothetical protein
MHKSKFILQRRYHREYNKLHYGGNLIITEVDCLECFVLVSHFFFNYLPVLNSFSKVTPTLDFYA